MRVLVITPPEPVVSWEDADAHLKLSGDETDKLYVEGLIAAATGHIDGPDGWLGRALGMQMLEARFEAYGRGSRVRLPYPPLIELVSAKYLDDAGLEQSIDAGALEAFGSDIVSATAAWPWSRCSSRPEAIRIRYSAGYAQGLPAPIRVAILLMVADMYRNRVTTQAGTQSVVPMSTPVEALLAPFRVYR